jgi:hypothetical protein
MERTAQRLVIFGLAAVLTFGGLVGLWAAASPSSVLPTGAPPAGPAVSTQVPAPPSVTGGVEAYLATFTETGLPSGTLWFVNITGQTSLATTTSTVSTLLAVGSYSYTVGSVSRGYSAPSNSFAVTGAAPVGLTIGFTAVAVSPAYSGPTAGLLSTGQMVVVVAGVAIAIVVGLVVVQVTRTYRPTGPLRPPAA